MVVFPFNGRDYPTYQDMVAAKRERNRLALAKAVGEISTELGDEYNNVKTKNCNNNNTQKSNRKSSLPQTQPTRRSMRIQQLQSNIVTDDEASEDDTDDDDDLDSGCDDIGKDKDESTRDTLLSSLNELQLSYVMPNLRNMQRVK